MTSEMHTHKTVSSHAGHNESERIVTPTPKVHYLDLHPAFESTEPMIQCEIATPAASQPSDSVTNLRFLSENIDQHAFSVQLPSSFSENMPPLRENTSHSSSYRESHTKFY